MKILSSRTLKVEIFYLIKGNCLMMENIEALSNSGEGNGTSHGAYQHMDYVDCGSGTKLQLYCDDRSCPDRCKYDCGVHV